MNDDWPDPSPGAAEIIRRATTQLLLDGERLFAEVDAAVIETSPQAAAGDPEVTAAISASDRSNLVHWATANLNRPGARVPPNPNPEIFELAREVVRRGLDDGSFEAYRVGQNIAWRAWMDMVFQQTSDPDELREVLDVTARSIAAFIDDTLAGIRAAMQDERARLISRSNSERLEVVNLILENAPITSRTASDRLRYELSRRHTAAIVWSDRPGPRAPGELEATVDALTHAAGMPRPLTVSPNPNALWAWFAGSTPLDLDRLRREATPDGGVRVALGTSDPGIDGFRRSHLHALATQRLMRRAVDQLAFAAYADVELVALATQDEERTEEFLTATLGELRSADPALRETLRTYIREEFSASRAARALFTHRNTVLNRLARAEQLLGVPLKEHGLEVGLALEIVHWLGARG
jgi:DNA-binding PucR family transcriptional regulator